MQITKTSHFGRAYLAIPGPSIMPEAVLQAMHRSAPNIYEGELVDLVETIVPDLCDVARTKGHVAMYIGNGHAAWEAALSNTVGAGEAVLVPTCGRFGHGWAEMARGLGITTDILDFGRVAPIDPGQVAEALKADKIARIKAVLVTHVDTSSSVRNDIAALRAAIDETGHPALLMVDCIASLGCDVFEMDAWGVDVALAASQKGLMVPPGLGFVFFSDKAAQVRNDMPRVSNYWDWTPRADPQRFFEYWNGTAPTHHLFGLRAALDLLKHEGIEAVWARHHRLARAIWAACDVWSQGGALWLNVAPPENRSHAVTAIHLTSPLGAQLRDWTQSHLGLTLGISLGMETAADPKGHGGFRIGHMGHVNGQMILGVLASIEAGLSALDIPRGRGAVDAAAESIAKSVSA